MINNTMFLTACSLFYSILLIIFVFRKISEKNKFKDKMYKGLIISNFFGILIELFCVYTCVNYKTLPTLTMISLKAFLIYLLSWITIFTLYIFGISYQDQRILKLQKIVKNLAIIGFLLASIIVSILPMDYIIKNDVIMYTSGSSVQFVYFVSELLVILCLFFMFRNTKTFKGQKYAPLFMFIAGGAFVMIVQAMHPELLLMTSMETFITFLIYFTSEKEAVQKSKEEKK